MDLLGPEIKWRRIIYVTRAPSIPDCVVLPHSRARNRMSMTYRRRRKVHERGTNTTVLHWRGAYRSDCAHFAEKSRLLREIAEQQ